MKNHIRNIATTVSGALFALLMPVVAFAQEFPDLTGGPKSIQPEQVIDRIVQFILGLAGAIAVVYLIWAGIQYITGGPKGADAAKAQIVNAIIGIAVILLAYVIVNVVKQAITGS